MQRQYMHFLNTGRAFVGHTDMNVGVAKHLGHLATATSRQTHHDHFALMGRINGGQYIGGIATGRDCQQYVSRGA